MMRRIIVVSLVGVGLILFAVHIYALDGIEGCWLRLVLGDDTEYARAYSDSGFRRIRIGMQEADVVSNLGPPLTEVWVYGETPESLLTVDFAGEAAVAMSPALGTTQHIGKGSSKNAVITALGIPRSVSLVYSRSPHDQSYRIRVVKLAGGRVIGKTSMFYAD